SLSTTVSCPCYAAHRILHSFPTRRSSDLELGGLEGCIRARRARFERRPLEFDEWSSLLHGLSGHRHDGGHPRRRRRAEQCHGSRSEEHTSELQSRENLVCRLLLEKKKE